MTSLLWLSDLDLDTFLWIDTILNQSAFQCMISQCVHHILDCAWKSKGTKDDTGLMSVFPTDFDIHTSFLTVFRAGGNASLWFSLNVFTEFAEFSGKNICHYSKRARTCHPAASCVSDQDATTVSAERIFKLTQVMLQWFIRFTEFSEFLFYLGKTPLSRFSWSRQLWVTIASIG